MERLVRCGTLLADAEAAQGSPASDSRCWVGPSAATIDGKLPLHCVIENSRPGIVKFLARATAWHRRRHLLRVLQGCRTPAVGAATEAPAHLDAAASGSTAAGTGAGGAE